MLFPDALEVRFDLEGFAQEAERARPGERGGDFVEFGQVVLGEAGVDAFVLLVVVSVFSVVLLRWVSLALCSGWDVRCRMGMQVQTPAIRRGGRGHVDAGGTSSSGWGWWSGSTPRAPRDAVAV